MVDFKELLKKASENAASLPSFPQKGVSYHINTKNPDFSPHDDYVEQENSFGKMVKRKQTVYYINTQEGILRISPNQMQQLSEVLAPVQLSEDSSFIEVCTENGVNGLFFRLPLPSNKPASSKKT